MTIHLRRRAGFSAGFLHGAPGLKGAGYHYLCELAVCGPIDPATGMVINIKEVDSVLKAQVTQALDGKLLDRDVPAFRDTPATVENLLRYIWEACAPHFCGSASLSQATLWATPAFWGTLFRNGKANGLMLTVTRSYDFSASHRLHSPELSEAKNAELFGKCNWANGHGHNYEVEVTLSGEPDLHTGELLSLPLLDRIVEEEVLTPYDHKHLNYDAPEFSHLNPTSENLTVVIWNKIQRRLTREPLGAASLYKVTVRETARNYFEYYGEEPV